MSSSDFAVQVRDLGKAYEIVHRDAQYGTLRDAVVSRLRHPFRKQTTREKFWALSNVTFDVKHGDVVGIIGRNGAGKSTLLKIMSRIAEPTTGEIRLHGRVGSLLEVGTGFHPELTGRENIFLNGAILGMRRAEIWKHFDEIVDFAGVERFLDTPVKRYSSGMYVRLAFSIAAHLSSDILVVDEVLAVGDAEFQTKCLDRMKTVSSSGRTVFFVSHNMAAIRTLCTTGLMLHQGALIQHGELEACIRAYLADARFRATAEWKRDAAARRATPMTINQVELELAGDQPAHELRVTVALESHGPHRPAFLAVDIHDAAGSAIMQACPTPQGFVSDTTRHHEVTYAIELPPLIPGQYLASVWVGSHNTDTYDFVRECVGFEVRTSPTAGRTVPHFVDHGYIVPNTAIHYSAESTSAIEQHRAG